MATINEVKQDLYSQLELGIVSDNLISKAIKVAELDDDIQHMTVEDAADMYIAIARTWR